MSAPDISQLSDHDRVVLLSIGLAMKEGRAIDVSEIATDTELSEAEVEKSIGYLAYIGFIRKKPE
jgi:predicted transcriptional regulator